MSTGTQELWVRQLEFVQAIIARLAGYGADLKNYCITLVTAVVGVAITAGKPAIGLIALLPIIVFAGLDVQYLRTERRYRDSYALVRAEPPDTMPSFDLNPERVPPSELWSSLASWSIWPFYAALTVGVLVIIYFGEMA